MLHSLRRLDGLFLCTRGVSGHAITEYFSVCLPQARMLELSEEEVKVRAAAAQQEHMATNELLTQVHTLGGDAQSR